MADFAPIVKLMKQRYRLRVRKWRRAMSGCAWRVTYEDGRTINWIEAPYPRTPISLAVFLHEVGHHAIGFERFAERCEEELHVWRWALQQMHELGVAPDRHVSQRFDLSMRYEVSKALRRGTLQLSEELRPFLPQAA